MCARGLWRARVEAGGAGRSNLRHPLPRTGWHSRKEEMASQCVLKEEPAGLSDRLDWIGVKGTDLNLSVSIWALLYFNVSLFPFMRDKFLFLREGRWKELRWRSLSPCLRMTDGRDRYLLIKQCWQNPVPPSCPWCLHCGTCTTEGRSRGRL